MKQLMYLALALLVAACEKPILNEVEVEQKEANVILHMVQFETSPLTPLQNFSGVLRRFL